MTVKQAKLRGAERPTRKLDLLSKQGIRPQDNSPVNDKNVPQTEEKTSFFSLSEKIGCKIRSFVFTKQQSSARN